MITMDTNLPTLLLFVASYLAGCFNAGYYLVRLVRGTDIRAFHSGNAGARNASRVLGKWGFILVFSVDAAKGTLVLAAGSLLVRHGMDPRLLPWLVPVVVAGHIWPFQLGFQGGKGLSTGAGAFLFADYRVVIGFLVAYAAIGVGFRSKRAGLIASFVVVPPLALTLLGGEWFLPSLATSILFVIAHRANLSRISRRALPDFTETPSIPDPMRQADRIGIRAP